MFLRRILPVVLSACWIASASAQSSAPAAQPAPCSEAEQKQLDFWVGEWDLTWPGQNGGAPGHGTNSVHRVLGGCVVQENFSGEDAMHLRGMSVSLFDVRSGKWKQTWVDNEGGYIDLVGGFANGEMTLSRQATRPDGTQVQMRMVYKNISKDEFDWSWESSKDGGKTWSVVWPIHYKRKN